MLTPLGPARAMTRGRGLVKLWCMPMPSRWGACCYLHIDAIRMEVYLVKSISLGAAAATVSLLGTFGCPGGKNIQYIRSTDAHV